MKVEVDPGDVETYTVDDYGRICVGRALAEKEIEVAILAVDGGE